MSGRVNSLGSRRDTHACAREANVYCIERRNNHSFAKIPSLALRSSHIQPFPRRRARTVRSAGQQATEPPATLGYSIARRTIGGWASRHVDLPPFSVPERAAL